MVSTELLRRYPFFAGVSEINLKAVALLAEEVGLRPGECLYPTGQPAEYLYLLIEGEVEHYLEVVDRDYPTIRKTFFLREVNPGEVFGLSAMVEPYRHTTTAISTRTGSMLRLDALALRELCAREPDFGVIWMSHIARSALDRLEDTRAELAATRA